MNPTERLKFDVPTNQHLPLPMTLTALTAFAALAFAGGITLTLPVLAVALVGSYFTNVRIAPRGWFIHWTARVILYSTIIFLNQNKPVEGLVDSLFAGPAMDTLGQIMAAETVIQAWRRQPMRPPLAACIILPTGITIAAACQTANAEWPRWFVGVYMLLLLLSLASGRRDGLKLRVSLAVLAVAAGALVYSGTWIYRDVLSRLGSTYLDERPTPASVGLNLEPNLSAAFGSSGSTARVLSIVGLRGVTYLRALSFDTYGRGHWGPSADNRQAAQVLLQPDATGPAAEVTPRMSTDALILAPINCAGINLQDNPPPDWSQQLGGPLKVIASTPSAYQIVQSPDANHQGPLADTPSIVEMRRCLSLPRDFDPRLRVLAKSIIGGDRLPTEKIVDIKTYLKTHHRYSLTFDPGPGDPVVNFLLQSPPAAAHCEYFATSAALLLRCDGVPTRYVIGYYAHEQDAPDVTAVRQRDAHAWVEAWVAGTGWVTVDATPSGGIPHLTVDSIPPGTRLLEWLNDENSALLTWIRGLTWFAIALAVAAVGLAALVLWALSAARAKKVPKHQIVGYTEKDAELAALAERFDRLLARQGNPCAPGHTWQEHLSRRTDVEPSNVQFVSIYNKARFRGAGPEEMDQLAQLITHAEQEAMTISGRQE